MRRNLNTEKNDPPLIPPIREDAEGKGEYNAGRYRSLGGFLTSMMMMIHYEYVNGSQ